MSKEYPTKEDLKKLIGRTAESAAESAEENFYGTQEEKIAMNPEKKEEFYKKVTDETKTIEDIDRATDEAENNQTKLEELRDLSQEARKRIQEINNNYRMFLINESEESEAYNILKNDWEKVIEKINQKLDQIETEETREKINQEKTDEKAQEFFGAIENIKNQITDIDIKSRAIYEKFWNEAQENIAEAYRNNVAEIKELKRSLNNLNIESLEEKYLEGKYDQKSEQYGAYETLKQSYQYISKRIEEDLADIEKKNESFEKEVGELKIQIEEKIKSLYEQNPSPATKSILEGIESEYKNIYDTDALNGHIKSLKRLENEKDTAVPETTILETENTLDQQDAPTKSIAEEETPENFDGYLSLFESLKQEDAEYLRHLLDLTKEIDAILKSKEKKIDENTDLDQEEREDFLKFKNLEDEILEKINERISEELDEINKGYADFLGKKDQGNINNIKKEDIETLIKNMEDYLRDAESIKASGILLEEENKKTTEITEKIGELKKYLIESEKENTEKRDNNVKETLANIEKANEILTTLDQKFNRSNSLELKQNLTEEEKKELEDLEKKAGIRKKIYNESSGVYLNATGRKEINKVLANQDSGKAMSLEEIEKIHKSAEIMFLGLRALNEKFVNETLPRTAEANVQTGVRNVDNAVRSQGYKSIMGIEMKTMESQEINTKKRYRVSAGNASDLAKFRDSEDYDDLYRALETLKDITGITLSGEAKIRQDGRKTIIETLEGDDKAKRVTIDLWDHEIKDNPSLMKRIFKKYSIDIEVKDINPNEINLSDSDSSDDNKDEETGDEQTTNDGNKEAGQEEEELTDLTAQNPENNQSNRIEVPEGKFDNIPEWRNDLERISKELDIEEKTILELGELLLKESESLAANITEASKTNIIDEKDSFSKLLEKRQNEEDIKNLNEKFMGATGKSCEDFTVGQVIDIVKIAEKKAKAT